MSFNIGGAYSIYTVERFDSIRGVLGFGLMLELVAGPLLVDCNPARIVILFKPNNPFKPMSLLEDILI